MGQWHELPFCCKGLLIHDSLAGLESPFRKWAKPWTNIQQKSESEKCFVEPPATREIINKKEYVIIPSAPCGTRLLLSHPAVYFVSDCAVGWVAAKKRDKQIVWASTCKRRKADLGLARVAHNMNAPELNNQYRAPVHTHACTDGAGGMSFLFVAKDFWFMIRLLVLNHPFESGRSLEQKSKTDQNRS